MKSTTRRKKQKQYLEKLAENSIKEVIVAFKWGETRTCSFWSWNPRGEISSVVELSDAVRVDQSVDE